MQLKKYPEASKLAQHQAVIKLTFDHNHPLESAHVLSFCPVDLETKEKYFSLFNMAHSAASARYYYETLLENEPDDAQQKLADRAVNPNPQDVSRLYNAWRQTQMGAMTMVKGFLNDWSMKYTCTMKDGESMEAKLNCTSLKYQMTQMMVRKQRMKLDLRPSVLNVKGASLSFFQSVHH